VDTAQLNGSRGHIYPMNATGPGPGTRAEITRDEYVIAVKDVLGVLWRRLWVILLVTGVLAGAAVGFDLLRTPTYEATIKILVGQRQDSGVPSSLGSDVQGLQQLTQTMAEVVPSRPVAEAVIDRLDLGLSPEEFLENLSVQQVGTTQVIEVSYEDESPKKAQQIANAVGTVFSNQVSEVSPSANAITATVWEQAAVPDSPASPNPVRDGLLAFILGIMVGIGLAFLLEQLVDPWRSPEEAEQISGVPTFGVIREFKAPKNKKGVS
jgi:capsular polysaccharide biosynthesis protein